MISSNVLYRYENTGEHIFLWSFHILKETPRGVWIDAHGKRMFVLSGDDGKRYAYRTKEGALHSFRKRKTRQMGFLNLQLDNARYALNSVAGLTPSQLEERADFTNMDDLRYLGGSFR